MGNCLQFLFFWSRFTEQIANPSTPNMNLPKRVSINCACFNSKVVDETDSSTTNNEPEEKANDEFHSID